MIFLQKYFLTFSVTLYPYLKKTKKQKNEMKYKNNKLLYYYINNSKWNYKLKKYLYHLHH